MAISKSRLLTTQQLIEQIRESNCNGERFCFILGSGASVESGIPSGNTLEMKWMNCIMGMEADENIPPKSLADLEKTAHELFAEKKLLFEFNEIKKEWETAKEKKQSLPSKYYFDIFSLRFYPNLRNGYRYLENLMERCEPSIGYHTLALLLTENKQNNLVITTNFDSLVEDALFLYTMKKPLVVNHESLAGYIESDIQRPIVAKIHRGLMYEPFNSQSTTAKLHEEWRDTLSYAFNTYTPMVIGYGGGDHSLMDYLKEELTKLRHGIYWCWRKDDGLPEADIQNFLEKKNGYLVEIGGFDALMMEIGKAMFRDVITDEATDNYLRQQYERRRDEYSKRWKELIKRPETKPIVCDIYREEELEFLKRKQENILTSRDYRNRGRRAHNEGDYRKAVEAYTEAIERDGTYSNDYFWRAEAYYELGEHKKAIEDYTTAIVQNPKYVTAYNNRGFTYNKFGEYAKAIEDFTKAIDLDPKDATAYNNRGFAHDDLGEYAKAIEDYNTAIKLNPRYEAAYNNRGFTYNKLGEYAKAIEDFTKAIDLDPKDAVAYSNRGLAYNGLREYTKAIQDCTKAIELDPKDANPHRHLGNAYYGLKEYQKALAELTEAIRLNPKYKVAYLDRAKVYRALGREAEAKADEERAAKL